MLRLYKSFWLPVFLMITSSLMAVISDIALSQDAPIISIKNNNYTIQGSTAAELRQQMNKLGHVEKSTGKHFDGYTHWYVSTNYRYQPVGNQCKIYTATVKIDVTFTMPQWNASAKSSSDLKKRWHRYINSLQTHENGHKNHGISAGNDVLRSLNSIIAPSCDQINAIAKEKTQAILNQYNQKDIEYDLRTQHGRTQGAVFP
jgi:predicted secreted Zn-dependent protease